MKLFECQKCGQQLYFQNTVCESCGSALGYLPERTVLSALEGGDGGGWHPLAAPGERWRFCANAQHQACNWMIPADAADQLCRACRFNRTIPDLDDQEHLILWQRIEAAKHRLIYSLMRLGLPLIDKNQDADAGLAFDVLADDAPSFRDRPGVMTGHAEGLITLNLKEADDALREQARSDMDEPYRTLLGHFRHEIGHYYWERLVRNAPSLELFRILFGDERADYGASLERHHTAGAPADWPAGFVSAYASAHPWEDFAESFAHYLHIVDTLETASALRFRVAPRAGRDPALSADVDTDPYQESDFDALLAAWLPVTYAVNSLNQSMGQPDLYPFVLAAPAIDKLRFIHDLLRKAAARA
ncbi:MAG: putative zinc-binding peptidase [Alphaproteobacteria bacterium]